MTMRLLTLLFTLVLLLLGISFAALNAEPVTVNFYVATISIPISLMIVIALGIGMLIGFLLIFFSYLKLKNENRKLKNRKKVTEKEVENLRAIPLKNEH